MRLLVLEDVSSVGTIFVVHQMRGEMFAGGERCRRVVFRLEVMAHGVGDVLGVVLLDLNGAGWFLDLSIRCLLHCFRGLFYGFR